MLTTRPFRNEDEAAVIDLWIRCGLVKPQNDPRKDIRRKTKVRPDLFLIGVLDGQIVASVMVGYEGHRGWINYLAVSPDQQKRGFGRRMMEEAERQKCSAGKTLIKEGMERERRRRTESRREEAAEEL